MIDIFVKPALRHLLTAASGYLAAKYGAGLEPSLIELLAAGGAGAIGYGWSVWEKRRR